MIDVFGFGGSLLELWVRSLRPETANSSANALGIVARLARESGVRFEVKAHFRTRRRVQSTRRSSVVKARSTKKSKFNVVCWKNAK